MLILIHRGTTKKHMRSSCSLLSIQNMMGGGRPAGGRHGSTKDTPSWTTIGLIFSFDHRGDPVLVGEYHGQIQTGINYVSLMDHGLHDNCTDKARWEGWYLTESKYGSGGNTKVQSPIFTNQSYKIKHAPLYKWLLPSRSALKVENAT